MHAIEVIQDDKYAHLATAKCTCGWKLWGSVTATMLDYKIMQHKQETGL